MWTKVLALQKCMVYIGLFHPCEHRANISDKDQGIELAFSIALADPNFLTTQRLSAFAQCPQLPEASRRSTGAKTSSQASEVAISKAAHLASSAKMENREIERRLRRRRKAPVNQHRTSSPSLTGRMFYNPHAYLPFMINSMRRICHNVIVAREGIPAMKN